MLVTDAVAAVLAEFGVDTVFGVVGSGNFRVTNALISRVRGSSRPGMKTARPAWPTAGPGLPAAPASCRCIKALAYQRADRDHRGG